MNLQAILVATDFSECAGAAFRMAKKLGERFEAKLVLLHVIDQRLVLRLAEYLKVNPDNLVQDLRERAQQQLGEFLKHWQTDGLEVESMVAVGSPFQEIAVIARELEVDLVALGGYGRGGRGRLEELFFGSTAEKVVRLLPCPVLCVPLAGKEDRNEG
jgi:nucleotide-binding universal stress UspA family protein